MRTSKLNSHVDEEMKKILDGFPKAAHPMGVLSSLTSALVAFNPSSVDVSSESAMYNSIVRILAKFPVLVAWTMRKKKGLPLDYGDDTLGYVENIHKMMFKMPNKEYKKDKIAIDALDKLLILHADHRTKLLYVNGSNSGVLPCWPFCITLRRYFSTLGSASWRGQPSCS